MPDPNNPLASEDHTISPYWQVMLKKQFYDVPFRLPKRFVTEEPKSIKDDKDPSVQFISIPYVLGFEKGGRLQGGVAKIPIEKVLATLTTEQKDLLVDESLKILHSSK